MGNFIFNVLGQDLSASGMLQMRLLGRLKAMVHPLILSKEHH